MELWDNDALRRRSIQPKYLGTRYNDANEAKYCTLQSADVFKRGSNMVHITSSTQ